ncbi:MAG: group II intron reverse transcriptase/maturase [Anaerolineae bacterium]|nr:group II intron reverse transcriptase/maturase [Gemmatimonadaceae bacterium]
MRLSTPENLRRLQRKLYVKSKQEPGYRFYSLYDKVWRKDVLEHAWRLVRTNRGAAGIDGMTIEKAEERIDELLVELQEELRTKRYRPQAVRRVYIPKPDGRQRPLGIPVVRDRIVQAAAKLVLEPIMEARFEPFSYGYRPKRGAADAMERVRMVCHERRWAIEVDVEAYFDSVEHRRLMKTLALKIADGAMLALIRSWLQAGVVEPDGRKVTPPRGVPQGGVISPLLSNVFLHMLDRYWRIKGMPKKAGRWDAQLIRYCDDVLVITSGPPEPVVRVLEERLRRMGLVLNRNKTNVVDLQEKPAHFLGFEIRRLQNRRDGGIWLRIAPSRKAEERIRTKIRAIVNHRRPVTLPAMVREVNPVVRGWVNYYRRSNASRSFRRIKEYSEFKVRKVMQRRRRYRSFEWHHVGHSEIYDELGLYADYAVR